MPHWLIDFCSWLQQSPFSQILQNVEWIVPAVQTVHILCIGAVISAALALALRQFGLLAADQPLTRVAAQFLRVIWLALPVLLVTGALLIAAEPRRSLASPAFQLKMALLVCVASLLLLYQSRIGRLATAAAFRPGKVITVVALLLWVGIIFAGRWIAYAGK
ncbi:MAG: hypothetical protein JWL65_5061 [Gammaproteobacteria bacterium]|jgi:hypothetical protein|nr:hypothetical protein [Gammaproteobacteria bacterium]